MILLFSDCPKRLNKALKVPDRAVWIEIHIIIHLFFHINTISLHTDNRIATFYPLENVHNFFNCE